MTQTGLLPIALAFALVAAAPGPANLALATVAMRAGRRPAIRFAAGLSLGLATWGLVAATGLGAVLQASVHALAALKLAGGFYLLWLAVQSARSAANNIRLETASSRPDHWVRRGLLLNLSNPKAVVAWMAALAMGLGTGDGPAQLATATVLCTLIGALNYAAYALAFSLPGAMAAYRRLRRGIDAAMAGLFAAAGIGLIRSAVSR